MNVFHQITIILNCEFWYFGDVLVYKIDQFAMKENREIKEIFVQETFVGVSNESVCAGWF